MKVAISLFAFCALLAGCKTTISVNFPDGFGLSHADADRTVMVVTGTDDVVVLHPGRPAASVVATSMVPGGRSARLTVRWVSARSETADVDGKGERRFSGVARDRIEEITIEDVGRTASCCVMLVYED